MHRIFVDLSREGPTCALLPFTGPAVITTSGLQWNLGAPTLRGCRRALALAPHPPTPRRRILIPGPRIRCAIRYEGKFPDRALCSIGGLLSTSNALVDSVVVVETDAPIVWTIERNPAGI